MKGIIAIFVVAFHLSLLYISRANPPSIPLVTKKLTLHTFTEEKVVAKVQKKVVTAPKPVAKKAPPQPKKVAKIAPKRDNDVQKSSLCVPKPISTLAANAQDENKSPEHLVLFLQNALQLPERGTVRVRLSILGNGKVEKVEIVSSESEKNSMYLTSEIQKMTLPMAGIKNQTVLIAFCNDS